MISLYLTAASAALTAVNLLILAAIWRRMHMATFNFPSAQAASDKIAALVTAVVALAAADAAQVRASAEADFAELNTELAALGANTPGYVPPADVAPPPP